jgi:hypothetical protein
MRRHDEAPLALPHCRGPHEIVETGFHGWAGFGVPVTPRLHQWHVIPVGDLRPHEPREQCWCRPEQDVDEDLGVHHIHRALDGRDAYESGQKGLH